VAWFGIVGDAAMRTRPVGRAVPALDQPRGEVEQALRGSRRDVLDGASQVRRQQVEQSRHGLVEDDVGDRRGQDDARARCRRTPGPTASNVSSVTAGRAMKRSYAAVQPVLSISIAPMAADTYSSSGVRNA
jgi:hypothetical protein